MSGPSPNPVPNRTIGEHGIVGDLDTAALVARDGTIDFCCWPHLDSPTVFAGLLDPDRGGEFALAPDAEDARPLQLYLPDTNVLLTRWLANAGSGEVLDLMPHPEAGGRLGRAIIRRIAATRGRICFRLRCRPRFDYGRIVPQVEARGDRVVFSSPGQPPLALWSTAPLTAGDGEARATIVLAPSEEALVVLYDAGCDAPERDSVGRAVEKTIAAWRRWSQASNYRGRWREEVQRSALALKLLTSHRHGSIAAAATFGLPEATGAERNWDYRATWIRDASFTVYAFMRLGYVGEAEHFREWITQRTQEADRRGELLIMYALDGSQAADEVELGHLSGYQGSRPVRIGNAAHAQQQLDIYGELLDSIYLSNKYGSAVSHQGWAHVCAIVEQVCSTWRSRDAGIWELRGRPEHLLHSRLMCWVAIDRAVRLSRKRSLPGPVVRWMRVRDRIAHDIWTEFRHPERGHFVQCRGGRTVDAALLMMPLVRFVSATDPIWLKTLDAIREELADDGLIYRYRSDDGLEGGEGAFTTCTFWYVECLARAGRLDEAHLAMAKGLRMANHLGLFSEEMSALGEPLGNFPQALTHLAFISAAYFLDRKLSSPAGGEWQP